VINLNKPLLEQYEEEYSKDPEYIAEGLALKVTEEMLQILHNKNKTQTSLAEQIGVSKARISRILNARPNMTLLTIAEIAIALGVKPYISLIEPQPTNFVFISATQSEALIDKQNVAGTVEFESSEPDTKNQSTYQMVTA
jgi:transcriptional regulator with XRE-family HTH domain